MPGPVTTHLRRLLWAGALALLATGCASREEESPYSVRLKFATFDAADTDHSGKLDREEAKAIPFVDYYFDAIDSDRNGLCSWNEVMHLDLRAVRRNQALPPGP